MLCGLFWTKPEDHQTHILLSCILICYLPVSLLQAMGTETQTINLACVLREWKSYKPVDLCIYLLL